jgi:hypothetical protein
MPSSGQIYNYNSAWQDCRPHETAAANKHFKYIFAIGSGNELGTSDISIDISILDTY